ncbi:MAG: TIGR00282 family metallophosphoesterase [Candidatus Margulisbacteria bacterium]|nr:TIGR00282 family metallophosphoesterase [Candidatus Margulisiibacteriota bacterium]
MIKVLFFGDIVGKIGRDMFFAQLPELKKKFKPDLVIINGENSANGKGITSKIYHSYLQAGVDCVTSGNHIFDNKEILPLIDEYEALIRPANYPVSVPGNVVYKKVIKGTKIAVVNFLGQVFMPPVDNPFHVFESMLNTVLKDSSLIIADIHAEATSEKMAFAYNYTGKLSAVCGTHTHIQTSDAQILGEHTAYITDLGMIGAKHSILGMAPESIINRFITYMPERIAPPETDEEVVMDYVFMEFDTSGKACNIESFHNILEVE